MSKGFTFIELVVATAILLGLVGFGTASYVNFNERTILENAAKDLKNTLRVAQENAIAGVKDSAGCTPTTGPNAGIEQTFRGWCISPVNSDPLAAANTPYDSYQIYGVCDTNEDGEDVQVFPAPDQIRAQPLPEGIQLITRAFKNDGSFDENDENGRARFNVFGNEMQLADNSVYTKVVYCLEGSFPSLGNANIYQITIQQSGEINDDGFVGAGSDCRL